ncbi:MAG TPA: flagellar biosynthesis protein FlhB [Holophaga sp.]|nr:flagellar biosynthesis protein FlhB [Holophaga sp.]HQL47532.1 flagellar biosynthesis protein FlhB [Holophaga sp.]
MAHDPSRTERATPRRREKAREDGSVLRVQDLDSAILLWGNFFLFTALWGSTFMLMGHQVAYFLSRAGRPGALTEGALQSLAVDILWITFKVVLPFLGANFALALANQFLQHGFKPMAKPLTPKFGKLNPAPGFKRLFSAKSMVELLKSLLKFLILIWVAYLVLGPRIPLLIGALKLPLGQSLQLLQDTLFILYRNVMIAMLALALADYFFQKYEFEKGIRMTKQEVKDEAKDAEGSPEVKGRQKSLMFSSMMRRIRTQVPQASVVITNPTHFAVALKYEAGSTAPICVAKGVDHLALKIRERAKASGVPVVENPPLARSLYRSVDLDHPIPPDLYQAVAQVLAFVYRIRGAA